MTERGPAVSVLKRLEELSEKATPRPWENDDVDFDRINDVGRGNMVARTMSNEPSRRQQIADALFVVAAINALPDLLRVVRAAEALDSVLNDDDDDWWWRPEHDDLTAALEALTKEED